MMFSSGMAGSAIADSPPRVTITCCKAGISDLCGAMRSQRSASQIKTAAPESAIPKASSSPVHHAFNGTTIAPETAAAKKATGHSGRLRIASATRSPFLTPHFCKVCANEAIARYHAS